MVGSWCARPRAARGIGFAAASAVRAHWGGAFAYRARTSRWIKGDQARTRPRSNASLIWHDRDWLYFLADAGQKIEVVVKPHANGFQPQIFAERAR